MFLVKEPSANGGQWPLLQRREGRRKGARANYAPSLSPKRGKAILGIMAKFRPPSYSKMRALGMVRVLVGMVSCCMTRAANVW